MNIYSINTQTKTKDFKRIKNTISSRVILVHGHNCELKECTALFLEKLGLEVIILHEQSSKCLTII